MSASWARRLFAFTVAGLALSGCLRPEYVQYTPSLMETEWDRYHQAEVDGQNHVSEAGYRDMCERDPSYPRACYDLSRLLFSVGRVDEARGESVRFIKGFPDDAMGPTAAKRLAASYAETRQWDEGRAALEALAEQVKGTDVYDSVLYRLGDLLRKAGRFSDEAQVLRRLIDTHKRWDSQLWDDAIWRLIQIQKEQGDQKAEKILLEKLLDTREPSLIIGSYNSPHHDDALLRLGYLFLEMGDHKQARKCFKDLTGLEASRLRDDGHLGIAKVEKALGRRDRACKQLQRIMDMPAANSRRKAKELSQSMGCP